MPVVAAAAIGAGGSLLAANSASKANNKAISATTAAADQATAEQRRQFDQSRADQQPWLATGTGALNQLASLYGLPTAQNSASFNEAGYLAANPDVAQAVQGGAFGGSALNHYQQYGQAENRQGGTTTTGGAAAPSGMAGFMASPDYQFRQNEQARALTARNSALGIQDSGAAQKAALQYSGNLASSEFNNYANRLASLAGVGQTAANNTAQLGQSYANQVGNIATNTGATLASSYQNQGAINSGIFQNIAGIGAGLANNYGSGNYNPLAKGGSLYGLY